MPTQRPGVGTELGCQRPPKTHGCRIGLGYRLYLVMGDALYIRLYIPVHEAPARTSAA